MSAIVQARTLIFGRRVLPAGASVSVRADVGLPWAGLAPGVPVVGTVTRLMPSKGNQYFVEAAVHVARAEPSARFCIVGEGELREPLEAQARTLGIADRLIFAGFRRDVAAALSAFDIVVFPSLWEGTPLTAFEALAMGKPIVATYADGLSYILSSGRDAIVVQKGHGQALAEAVVRLLRHLPRRELWARRHAGPASSTTYSMPRWRMMTQYDHRTSFSWMVRLGSCAHEPTALFFDASWNAVLNVMGE